MLVVDKLWEPVLALLSMLLELTVFCLEFLLGCSLNQPWTLGFVLKELILVNLLDFGYLAVTQRAVRSWVLEMRLLDGWDSIWVLSFGLEL